MRTYSIGVIGAAVWLLGCSTPALVGSGGGTAETDGGTGGGGSATGGGGIEGVGGGIEGAGGGSPTGGGSAVGGGSSNGGGAAFGGGSAAGGGGAATGGGGASTGGGTGGGGTGLGGGIGTTSADFYVDPAGNDSNSGTSIASPFLTLDKARTAAQALGKSRPLTIALRGGTYYSTSVTFTANDSGDQANPITYRNYATETPVLSGGERLTGWTNSSGNTWKLTLASTTADFENLFYNGQRRLRPRLGSGALGQYFRVQAQDTSCTGVCYDRFFYAKNDPISTSWANYAPSTGNPCGQAAGAAALQGDIEVLAIAKWDAAKLRIACIDPTRTNGGTAGGEIYFTGATLKNDNQGFIAKHRYLVENVKDQLATGEWFLDKSSTPWVLTYLANTGENPNTDVVEIPQALHVVKATGLAFVSFNGLTFEHDNYVVPAPGYASKQQDPTLPAAFNCNACTDVTFDGDTFTQTSSYGLDCVGACQNIVETNGTFFDIGGGGIRFGLPGAPSDTDSNVPQKLSISNTGFTGMGRVFPSGDCIQLGDSHDTTISNIECSYTYHAGIEVCMPSGGYCSGSDPSKSHGVFNTTLRDNVWHNIGLGVTNDLGCIYAATSNSASSGTGNVIDHNLCHDVNDASPLDNDGYGGHGIYLDTDTGAWDVKNNLVYRVSAIAFNMSFGPSVAGQPNVFENNIAAHAQQAVVGVQVCAASANIQQFVWKNALTYQDKAVPIQKAGGRYFYSGAPTQIQDWNHNQYFNTAVNWATSSSVFFSQTTGPNSQGNCGGSTSYPFSTGMASWQAFGEDTGSVIADPGFTAPSPGAVTGGTCACADTVARPGVCDDYSLPQSFSGAGFVPFKLNGWGRNTGAALPTVADTLPTKTFNACTDF